MATQFTQTKEADERFLKGMLQRYGSAEAALEQARKLRHAGEHGQAWWLYQEGRLAYLIAQKFWP